MTISTMLSPTELQAATRALVNARRTNLGIEVTMPVVYPTGQMVTVVITVADGDYLVHDAGLGAMCLTSAGARLSAQLERRLMELARHYGCEFIDGRMSRYASESQLALAIVMVANASRTVGDQSIYIRRQHETDFRKVVADRVRGIAGRRLRESEEILGQSGRAYHVPNVVLDQLEREPVAFIIPLSSRALVKPHFADFWDLRQRFQSVENDSVYDEAEAFRPEDWNLLRAVSEIVPLGAVERHIIGRGWTA
jgi:hypothetical protein